MNKQSFYRIFFYVLGLLILALGLTLNTKAGLDVSPIISVSYSVAHIFGLNFGNTTMFLYCVFVLAQLVLHGIQWKQHPRNRLPLCTADGRAADSAESDIHPVSQPVRRLFPGSFRRGGGLD